MANISIVTRAVITVCFMILLMALSIAPGRAQLDDTIFSWIVSRTPTTLQKMLHACLYGVLTLLWVWTLDAIYSKRYRLVIAVTVAISFGAAMEWYQTKVPGRFGTLVDVAFNAAGACLAALGAIFLL